MRAGESSESTGSSKGMPSTRACRPRCRAWRRGRLTGPARCRDGPDRGHGCAWCKHTITVGDRGADVGNCTRRQAKIKTKERGRAADPLDHQRRVSGLAGRHHLRGVLTTLRLLSLPGTEGTITRRRRATTSHLPTQAATRFYLGWPSPAWIFTSIVMIVSSGASHCSGRPSSPSSACSPNDVRRLVRHPTHQDREIAKGEADQGPAQPCCTKSG